MTSRGAPDVRTFNKTVVYQRVPTIVNRVLEDSVLDRTYAALADPTRRSLLVTLQRGEARIKDLAAPLPMTMAGVSRHVRVLEDAGLVARDVRGREHWVSLRPDGLQTAEQWIASQTAFWSARVEALAERLERRAVTGPHQQTKRARRAR